MIALLALMCPAPGRAAWHDDVTLGGYARESALAWKPSSVFEPAVPPSWQYTNLVHARLNTRAYLSPAVTLGLDLKARLVTGDAAQQLLDLAELFRGTHTWFDWEHRFVDEENAVLAALIDRAWIDGEKGRVQITVGRQRIAWGTGLVWNPIDIFNPSSPLDFDNEEKPGTDAGRAQVYLGPNSKAEAAVAPARHADDTVAALQLVVNYRGYDWSVLGGRRGPVTVFGGAWAGSIRGGGFRGELLYAVPRQGWSPTDSLAAGSSCFFASADGDYTFRNSLYLHAAVLYNDCGSTGDAGGRRLIEAYQRLWLTSGRLSLYGEIAGDVTPLLRAELAGILNPFDDSFYVGPLLRWSAITDLDVIASGLLFGGRGGTEFGDESALWMLWIKYSF